MFDHPIIDVALGLMLLYILLSSIVSAVQELVASCCDLRARNLCAGIKNLIDGPCARPAFAEKVYDHPLIKNLARAEKLPPHVAPETLSAVLLDVVAEDKLGKSYAACTPDEVRALAGKIDSEHPLQRVLETFTYGAGDLQENLKQRVAEWFDEGMTRVSGWYKRRVKIMLWPISVAVTVAMNASSFKMAAELWQNEALRIMIAHRAVEVADGGTETIGDDALKQLRSFPIGWCIKPDGSIELPDGWLDWGNTLLGWLVTVVAISLGAPFWFDLLGKVANLRGSGGKSRRIAGS